MEESIDDIAVRLVSFVKYTDYPEKDSKDFLKLTNLMNSLEMAVRKKYGIKGKFPH